MYNFVRISGGFKNKFVQAPILKLTSERASERASKPTSERASRRDNMKKYKITFTDEFECLNEEHSYETLLNYLKECVQNEDVTAFEFKEVNQQASEQKG